MATTGTTNNREIITDAFRKIGVTAHDEELQAHDAATGLRALNRLLKAWQNHGHLEWTIETQSIALVFGAEQVLDPVRPIRVISARIVRNGVEIPMVSLTRDEYDRLPQKSTIGTPTQYFYDRQREAARLYVWPTSANGETLNITYEREVEDQTDLDAIADVPGEWLEALVYGLAARLADDYRLERQMVVQRAETELRLALSQDHRESIYFGPEYADY